MFLRPLIDPVFSPFYCFFWFCPSFKALNSTSYPKYPAPRQKFKLTPILNNYIFLLSILILLKLYCISVIKENIIATKASELYSSNPDAFILKRFRKHIQLFCFGFVYNYIVSNLRQQEQSCLNIKGNSQINDCPLRKSCFKPP